MRKKLSLLRAVTAARLIAADNSECIPASANNLITHTWQIANTTTAHKHDRVLLQIVTFTWDVHGDFFAVAQPNSSDLSKGRIGLLRSHGSDQQANPLLLRALLKYWAFGRFALNNAVFSNQLIDGWHTVGSRLAN